MHDIVDIIVHPKNHCVVYVGVLQGCRRVRSGRSSYPTVAGRVVHVRAENAQNAARNRDANAQKAGEMWRDDQCEMQ